MIEGLEYLGTQGVTPLAAATNLIAAQILPMVPSLMMKQERVCVVIATDGLPTDVGFEEALKRLQVLPVWVVVRLCTDQDEVIDYYNGLDAELEAPMEVLDDLLGEAHEVCQLNRWLTYGSPMHTARVSAQFQLLPLSPVVEPLLCEPLAVRCASRQPGLNPHKSTTRPRPALWFG